MNNLIAFYTSIIALAIVSVAADGRNPVDSNTTASPSSDKVTVADSIALSPVIITATRREQKSAWVSDDHTVIPVEHAPLAVNRSASELVSAYVPAFMSDYGGGSAKKVSLRGAGSERTLVLVDGIRTGTSDNDLSDIPASIIKKIEIVEGGQSALYGMDAIGGVVNVITRRPVAEGISGSYSSMVGSYEPSGSGQAGLNTNAHQASVSARSGLYEGFFSGDWRFSDGRYDYNASGDNYLPRDSNTFKDLNLFARVGRTFDNITASMTGSMTDRRIQNPGSLSWPVPGTTRKRLRATGIDAAVHQSPTMAFRMHSAFGSENIRFVNNDRWDPQDSRHERLYGDVELLQEFTFGRQLVTTGMELRKQHLTSNEIGNHDANQAAVFAGGVCEMTEGPVTIKATPSLRFDYSDLYGGSRNGKVGVIAALRHSGEPAVFANVGTASRSPTFNDLFWPKDPYGVGNPDLKPERSMNVDAGFQSRFATNEMAATGRITGYFMNMHDMILWQPDPSDPTGMLWSPRNVARALIRGIHGSAQVTFANRYFTTLGIGWNDARDAETDNRLIYRPEFTITYANELTVDPFFAGITCRHVSEVFTDAMNSDRLPGNTIFDANVGMQLFKTNQGRTAVGLSYDLCNLTNELRSTNQGYPLPGREHRLGIKVSF